MSGHCERAPRGENSDRGRVHQGFPLLPRSWGTEHVAVAVAEFPARSLAVAVRVETLPVPFPDLLARSQTVQPVMTMSGVVFPSPSPSSSSLLTAVTSRDPGATPDRLSLTLTAATWTRV
jgi:hypothetical protein